ncbi:MAG: glycerol-3-phosphate cytidyltransferase TagD [Microgenomates group bacterium Gr01-1014_7]|nr:MAG: glycerol-3-phosphate cytidyltransferase TagD [Microgenomates group bacterium Gr01-1014_7]
MGTKKIVLVGGCFDVLHPGHVIFLEKAKEEGDFLMVLLEPDQKVKKLKGIKRPVHSQKERAKVLLALKSVDQVVMLPNIETEKEYNDIIKKIKPDVIAATKGDKNARFHKRSANLAGAKFKYVTNIIGDYSTSRILNSR